MHKLEGGISGGCMCPQRIIKVEIKRPGYNPTSARSGPRYSLDTAVVVLVIEMRAVVTDGILSVASGERTSPRRLRVVVGQTINEPIVTIFPV